MPLDGPLGSFADAVLVKVIELEQADASYVGSIGGRVEKGIGAIFTLHPGLLHPSFNQVLGVDAEGQEIGTFIARLDSVFAAERLPYQVVFNAVSRPAFIAQALGGWGFARASRRLWMELMGTSPFPSGDLRISVEATDDLSLWAQALAEGLALTDHREFLLRVAKAAARHPNHALLLARYGRQPAGTCEVSVDEGIAFIRRVCVLPAFYQKEIARGLLHAACEAAYGLNAFRVATKAFHGTGAEAIFERLGFTGLHVSEEMVREYPPFLLD